MATLPYLTRRGGGRYDLQMRMPHGPAWPALLRLSLHTSDPRMARRGLCNALSWLMPIRDAPNLVQQAEEITAQCRQFTRAGPAATWQQLEDRQRFELTFSRFAGEARNSNVPEEVRLVLLREWEFFSKALRRDEVRLYERGSANGPATPNALPHDLAGGDDDEPAGRAAAEAAAQEGTETAQGVGPPRHLPRGEAAIRRQRQSPRRRRHLRRVHDRAARRPPPRRLRRRGLR